MGALTVVFSRSSRKVMKAMAMFGGVQIAGILCSIVRTKLVALWIGAVGVGLFGIYNVAVDMLATVTQLSLRQSAVREISQTSGAGAMARFAFVVRRWALVLGVAGVLLTFVCAPLLSCITFGGYSNMWNYAALAVVMILTSATGAEAALLQGAGHLQRLARMTLWGVIGGLAVSVPLFYFLGVDSIIPSIIAYSLCGFVAARIFRVRHVYADAPRWCDSLREGMPMLRLGVYMTVSSFATIAASYLFLAWLNRKGGAGEAGYYQGGFTLVNRYVGIVLAALAVEYYPRLSRAASSVRRMWLVVRHEMSVVLAVLVPCVVLFVVFRRWVIELLYTPDFAVIDTYVVWAMVGNLLRAASWCLAFMLLARGLGRTYLVVEVISAVLYVVLNIAGYSRAGFDGLGYAYVVWYGVYLAIVAAVVALRCRRGAPPLIASAS